MALISKVSNLFFAGNLVADKITTVAKGILCIPSIISGLFSGAGGGIANAIKRQLVTAAADIIDGLTSMMDSIINDALSEVTGFVTDALNTLLKIQATILGTVSLIKDFYKGLKDRTQDVSKFLKSKNNCQFAAAELFACIASTVTKSLTKKTIKGIVEGATSKGDLISSFTNKIVRPGDVIEGYTGKIGKSIDKATKQVLVTSSLL